jgi:S1-C subfamily serine protease
MVRLSIGVFLLVAVALAFALGAYAPAGVAQNYLPTPRGQLGGAPAAPSAAIPLTPPVPPLATIPIVEPPALALPTPASAGATAGTAVAATAFPAASATPVGASAARSVVAIETPDRSAPASGVVVADGGVVVTALDAVGSAPRVEVVDAEGGRSTATVIGRDPESGLTVLRLAGSPRPALAIAGAPPATGAGATVVGAGPGDRRLAEQALVAGTTVWFPSGPPAALLIAIDPPVANGMNGGALVDANGELAGVLIDDRLAGDRQSSVSSAEATRSVRFAVPAPVVARVVDETVRQGHVAYPYLGVVIAPAADATAGPALVVQVAPGGPAARAGIEPGDLLLGLDGATFGPMLPASVALLAHAPDDRVALIVRRAGVERTVEATLGARPGA